MMYGSWDMKCDQIFCHWGLFFAIFTPVTTKKLKFWKSDKTPGDIIIHKCTKNHDHMLYCSLDIACDGCKCCF